MGNHAFLSLAALAVLCHGFLFLLKLSDLLEMKRERRNGPMLFMKRDNIRHQAFMLAASGCMVLLAVSWMDLITGLIAFTVLSIGDALFVYRRRGKLAVLIAAYEAQHVAVPGGKRATDPPAPH